MVIFDLLTRNTEIDQTGLTLYVVVGEELETGVVVEKVESRSVDTEGERRIEGVSAEVGMREAEKARVFQSCLISKVLIPMATRD